MAADNDINGQHRVKFSRISRLVTWLVLSSLVIYSRWMREQVQLYSTPSDYTYTTVRPRIVHVWSPYVVYNLSTESQLFAPLNQAQNITWASMWRAQQNYLEEYGNNISIVCAILWMDVEVLTQHQPPLCPPENTVILNRSTATEFPNLQPPIHYPFVQDILSAAAATADYDYLVLTNSDIALSGDFYRHIRETVLEGTYDVFRVNRLTLDNDTRNNHPLSSQDLSWIEAELFPTGNDHPGTDCFVMSRPVADHVNLGMLFVGHPPWARFLKSFLISSPYAKSYGSFPSKSNWTFHIGDEQTWLLSGTERNLTRKQIDNIHKCPVTGPSWIPKGRFKTDHWHQNVKSCAQTMKIGSGVQIQRHKATSKKIRASSLESMARTWNYPNHSWCHRDRDFPGLVYVKIPKTGTSTYGGIHYRIAKRMGERKWNTHNRSEETTCSSSMARQARDGKAPRLIWTFVRDPLERGLAQFFHFSVSRRGVEPSQHNLRRAFQEFLNYQVKHTATTHGPKTIVRNNLIQESIQKFDFIGLWERNWESLAVMKILWGLDTSDLIVMSTESGGEYDDGRFEDRCVKIQKPNISSEDPDLQDFVERFRESNHDYTLYDVVNRSLDLTIERIGKDVVHQEMRLLRAAQAYAEEKCLSTTMFPCSSNGTRQMKLAEEDCYGFDHGCGHRCTDRLFSEGYTIPGQYFPDVQQTTT